MQKLNQKRKFHARALNQKQIDLNKKKLKKLFNQGQANIIRNWFKDQGITLLKIILTQKHQDLWEINNKH